MLLPNTPSQTVGPFYSIGLVRGPQTDVVGSGTAGAIRVRGVVYDGDGEPVPDAVIEIWQADEMGTYRHDFGWARSGTHPHGEYSLHIVKPGRLDGAAPHVNVQVFGRGLMKQLFTRMYFPDESEANAADPVFSTIDDARRGTLTAVAEDGGVRFDIRLQGENETVFFDLGF
ncbi:MAG TPA: protocatechuate 3,4-dioxygenase subunit alpha [Gaiellaceae bacterium]